MKDWFLGKVNELGEKAVDSVVNIVLSRNDKTITDFKQTPLITAISRSVNTHIAIKQPNVAKNTEQDDSAPRIGMVQMDLLESNYLMYPAPAATSTDATSPVYPYYGKSQTDGIKGRVRFDGLGSIPTSRCQYSVSMACNGKMAFSPAVEMECDSTNQVIWNHQFIAYLDDLWVDLGLSVHAEIDFNQFSQQKPNYGSPRMVNTAKRIPGLRCAQLSRSEAAEMDSEETQRLTSIYGKTKYKQCIGRAVVSLPVLLDSTELRSTALLTEGTIHASSPIGSNEDLGYSLVAVPGEEHENGPHRPLGNCSTPTNRRPRDVSPSIGSSSYRSREHPYLLSDSNMSISDRRNGRGRSSSQLTRSARWSASREAPTAQRIVRRITSNTLRDINELLNEESTQVAKGAHKGNGFQGTKQLSIDAYHSSRNMSPVMTYGTEIDPGSDDKGSFKSCNGDSEDELEALSGHGRAPSFVRQVSGTNYSIVSRQSSMPTTFMSLSPTEQSSTPLNAIEQNRNDFHTSANLPLRIETAAFPDIDTFNRIPTPLRIERQASFPTMEGSNDFVRVASLNGIKDLDLVSLEKGSESPFHRPVEEALSLEEIRKEYRYYAETVMTLQLLPLNEHKWDEEKFLRPVEGYPSFGMKTPSEVLGYIKIRIRVYLRNHPNLLAITSNMRHPRIYWQIPNELEMLHLSLIFRRIELYFRHKPRWVDKILLPKHPRENVCFVAGFWFIMLDLMVFSTLPRMVFDFYLLTFVVSLFYKTQIGVMKYPRLTDSTEEKRQRQGGSSSKTHTQLPQEAVRSIKSSQFIDNFDRSRESKNGDVSYDTTQSGQKRDKKHGNIRDHSKSKTDTNGSESVQGAFSDKGRITLDSFKGSVESSSTLLGNLGERKVILQHHPEAFRSAIFADDLGDTDYEKIVKIVVFSIHLGQLILGYTVLLAEKIRISLACPDSLSWLMLWASLGIIFIVHYGIMYLVCLVPFVTWRLGLYVITVGYCFSFHSNSDGLIAVVTPQLCSHAWNQFKKSLWFFTNILQRIPDSREIDHRKVSVLQNIYL